MSTPKIPNAYTIEFVENYIDTLIKQYDDPQQVINRLLEEGMVAYKAQLTKVITDAMKPGQIIDLIKK